METRLNTKSKKKKKTIMVKKLMTKPNIKHFFSYKQNSQRERERERQNNLHCTDCYLAECMIEVHLKFSSVVVTRVILHSFTERLSTFKKGKGFY